MIISRICWRQNIRLCIDYDSSLHLPRWLESLLENELNPKRVPQSQMGAWERMYECVESGLYHCRKNLEEENDGVVRDFNLISSITDWRTLEIP